MSDLHRFPFAVTLTVWAEGLDLRDAKNTAEKAILELLGTLPGDNAYELTTSTYAGYERHVTVDPVHITITRAPGSEAPAHG
ncbi:hypothetical protein GCM10029964_128950 [Kibdelosporangium lantanae]